MAHERDVDIRIDEQVERGTCTVEVTECSGDCADAGRANYSLSVTRNGNPAQLELIADDQP